MELAVDAVNARDIDALMSLYAPDAVFEHSEVVGVFEGRATFRGSFDDWLDAYEEFRIEFEARRDLGNGVTFGVTVLRGRPGDSTGWIQGRFVSVVTWRDGLVERVTNYFDIDKARAAAERRAEERG
jgi:ketosteroid isomerase-like protein